MVLQRIALLVLALYIIWRVITIWGRNLQKKSSGSDDFSRFSARSRDRRRRQQERSQRAVEELVACSRCGTLIPMSRAILAHGSRSVCSVECRDATEG